jgi:DNA ligase 4
MLIIAACVDIVHSSNGTTQRVADDNSLKNDDTKHLKRNKNAEKTMTLPVSHSTKCDS